MLENCMSTVFAHRRLKFELHPDTQGAIILDGFGGHTAEATRARREVWEEVNRVTILCLPPHSSSELQPMDRIHAYWRKLCDCAEEIQFGFDHNVLHRLSVQDNFW